MEEIAAKYIKEHGLPKVIYCNPCRIEELALFASKYKIPVVENRWIHKDEFILSWIEPKEYV